MLLLLLVKNGLILKKRERGNHSLKGRIRVRGGQELTIENTSASWHIVTVQCGVWWCGVVAASSQQLWPQWPSHLQSSFTSTAPTPTLAMVQWGGQQRQQLQQQQQQHESWAEPGPAPPPGGAVGGRLVAVEGYYLSRDHQLHVTSVTTVM